MKTKDNLHLFHSHPQIDFTSLIIIIIIIIIILMATTHLHRKLIDQSPTNSTFYLSICPIQCNFESNPTRICATECIPYCPLFCLPAGSSPTPAPATTPENLPTPPDHHHHHISLPLKISLVFIIATFIYILYKLYTLWFRSRLRRTPPPLENQETFELIDVVDHPIWYIRTTGLQPEVIEALAVVKYKAAAAAAAGGCGGGGVEGSDCSVCLTEFEEDDTLRLLPKCKHAFHMSCIDTWLRSHTNCPLCRAVIVDNAADAPPPERNDGDLGVVGEIDLGVSSIGDGDREEASGSSGLRIGESDEDDVNNSSLKNDGS